VIWAHNLLKLVGKQCSSLEKRLIVHIKRVYQQQYSIRHGATVIQMCSLIITDHIFIHLSWSKITTVLALLIGCILCVLNFLLPTPFNLTVLYSVTRFETTDLLYNFFLLAIRKLIHTVFPIG